MRLLTGDVTHVKAEGTGWAATWTRAAPFRKVPVRVLHLRQTALATLTEADVVYYQRYGRWPPYDRLALDPRWEYPTPAADGTADRREFHDWRAGSGFRGRPLLLVYSMAREARQLRTFALAVHYGLKENAFRRLALGETYWWVQAGDPQWMGWDWTDPTAPEYKETP